MMSNRKTICFFIFAVGNANGGHYRSLRMVAETLNREYDVLIFNLGFVYSHIIKSSEVESHFVYFNGLNFFHPISRIKRILKDREVDYFHAFDYHSSFIMRLIANIFKKPAIQTKCGGPNPKGYFPSSKYLTVFSQEDYTYFSGRPEFKDTSVSMIPHRVEKFNCDAIKIGQLKKKYDMEGRIVFLRICRICDFYAKSIQQSISLVQAIGGNATLLVVGNIQDQKVYDHFAEQASQSNNIFIETNKEYTNDAKSILDIADFVIGTGRGFMEASSRGKVMMAPSLEGEYPIFISEESFLAAFSRNFSERIVFDAEVIESNLEKVRGLIANKTLLNAEGERSIVRFQAYFSLEEGAKLYKSLYERSKYLPEKYVDLFKHGLFVMYKCMGTWYRNPRTLFKS